MTTPPTDKNYLDMSDEDFMNISAPESADPGSEGDKSEDTNQDKTTGQDTDPAEGANQAKDKSEDTDGTGKDDENKDGEGSEGSQSDESTKKNDEDGDDKSEGEKSEGDDDKSKDGKGETAEGADPAGSKDGGTTTEKGEADKSKDIKDTKDGEKKPDTEGDKDDKAEKKDPDYRAFFDQVMKPFKANGREIQLKSPEEAIRLMQMGAGYGKKLQNLQPALKTLKMLEKNDLLDEAKLSFLIDINNKNPDAIKKLIKDSGIDPLDLNIGDNVSYSPKSHSVSDEEMAFHSVIDEVKDSPTGPETLRIINQTWDAKSKAALADQPKILSVIHTQRENGIYPQIVAEIDRQKLLGQIAPTTPFLEAYKLAGDHLTATKALKVQAPIQDPAGGTQQPQVIEKRTAAPKSPVQNSDKAAAAAPTKTSPPKKPGKIVNPLSLPDDEFMKQAEGLSL